MQICINIGAVFDIKRVRFLVSAVGCLASREASKQEWTLCFMDSRNVLTLQQPWCLGSVLNLWTRLFVNDSGTADGQESGVRVAVVDVPLEGVGEPGAVAGTVFMIGAGSGTGSVAVDGAGSVNGAPVGGQPDDCVVEMLDSVEIALDFPEAE